MNIFNAMGRYRTIASTPVSHTGPSSWLVAMCGCFVTMLLCCELVSCCEQTAIMCLQASQGDVEQASLLVHQHADLLLQPASQAKAPSGPLQSSPAPQQALHQQTEANMSAGRSAVDRQPNTNRTLGMTPVQSNVSVERQPEVQCSGGAHTSNNRSTSRSPSPSARQTSLHMTAHLHGQTSALSKTTSSSQLGAAVRPLLPAGVSLPSPVQVGIDHCLSPCPLCYCSLLGRRNLPWYTPSTDSHGLLD